MPIFDAHVHIFPDAIAARVVAQLAAEAGITAAFHGSRAELEISLRQAGIDGALNCPIATRPEQVESINTWAIAQHRWPVLSLGSIHQEYPRIRAELERLRNRGLPGIKMHPEYQAFRLEDAAVQPIWDACEQLGLVVFLHAGEDAGFTPPCRLPPASLRWFVERYPRLPVVAAHFGGWRLWADVEKQLLGRPLFLDLSFVLGFLPDARIVDLVRRHGVERVLFATDAPWRDQREELEAFRRLPFTAAEERRLLWDNAAGLFGLQLPA
jgi:uncharacterized protein